MKPPELRWEREELGNNNNRWTATSDAPGIQLIVEQIWPPSGGKGITATIVRRNGPKTKTLWKNHGWDAPQHAQRSAEAAAFLIINDEAAAAAEAAAEARQAPPSLADFQAHGE